MSLILAQELLRILARTMAPRTTKAAPVTDCALCSGSVKHLQSLDLIRAVRYGCWWFCLYRCCHRREQLRMTNAKILVLPS